ncbi:hypothetical protein C0991_002081 [Blastosporella zonata]|nr:hypothetical protein C0991_002081 [Blastosporella zonata]
MKQEVIDVDAKQFIDLTKIVSIDLTDDNDIQEVSRGFQSRWPPKVANPHPTHKNLRETERYGPASFINISPRAPTAPSASSSRQSSSLQPPAKKRRLGSAAVPSRSTIIVIDDDDEDIKPSSSRQASTLSRTPVKRDSVLELDSDGDDVIVKAKMRRQKEEETDEEEAYARCHAGYDVNNEDIWISSNRNRNKMSFGVANSLGRFSLSSSDSSSASAPRQEQPRLKYARRYYNDPNSNTYAPILKWMPTFSGCNHLFPPVARHLSNRLPFQLQRRTLQRIIQPMKEFTSFKHAPGSVNHIEQREKIIAIASAATGGDADYGPVVVDPYNKEGAISIWNGKTEVLPGHYHERTNEDSSLEFFQPIKYYTISDVKFDPCSPTLVSAGNDKSVHIWTYTNDNDYGEVYGTVKPFIKRFPYPPTGLAFKPGTSTVAVAERVLVLFTDVSTSDVGISGRLALSGGGVRRDPIGAMAWGHGSSSNHLFASSEPLDQESYFGNHKAVDAERWKVAYSFDESGAGDEIAVSTDGISQFVCLFANATN